MSFTGDGLVVEAHPSATVVLVRDSEQGLETLLLCKSENVNWLSGMWVFPGGRVDEEDYTDDRDVYSAAHNAAIRETIEEADFRITSEQLHYFSHWTTPEGVRKRFSTWFFVALTISDQAVIVDGGEISKHRWVSPQEAITASKGGDLKLMPPTYITLLKLTEFNTINEVENYMCSHQPVKYFPKMIKTEGDGMYFLYQGDAGYETTNLDAEGARHRTQILEGNINYLCDF